MPEWQVEGSEQCVTDYEGGLHRVPEDGQGVILARNKNRNKCIPVGMLFSG